jgi:predicted RNA binding protein YcfA (HicA-like mRNA interferase family)
MAPVPSVSGDKVIKALERHGFKLVRVRGSHHIMRHPDGRGAAVPVHRGRDMSKGTLRSILRDVDLTAAELDL